MVQKGDLNETDHKTHVFLFAVYFLLMSVCVCVFSNYSSLVMMGCWEMVLVEEESGTALAMLRVCHRERERERRSRRRSWKRQKHQGTLVRPRAWSSEGRTSSFLPHFVNVFTRPPGRRPWRALNVTFSWGLSQHRRKQG